MVVDQIHVEGPAFRKTEDDPLIGANRDGPKVLQIALQAMEPETGMAHSLDGLRSIKGGEYIPDALQFVGRQAAPVIIRIKASEPFVPKAFDHGPFCKLSSNTCQAG